MSGESPDQCDAVRARQDERVAREDVAPRHERASVPGDRAEGSPIQPAEACQRDAVGAREQRRRSARRRRIGRRPRRRREIGGGPRDRRRPGAARRPSRGSLPRRPTASRREPFQTTRARRALTSPVGCCVQRRPSALVSAAPASPTATNCDPVQTTSARSDRVRAPPAVQSCAVRARQDRAGRAHRDEAAVAPGDAAQAIPLRPRVRPLPVAAASPSSAAREPRSPKSRTEALAQIRNMADPPEGRPNYIAVARRTADCVELTRTAALRRCRRGPRAGREPRTPEGSRARRRRRSRRGRAARTRNGMNETK